MMPVEVTQTPNPNAMKFTVGVSVGDPRTFVKDAEIDDPNAAALLAIDDVASVFMTADFVTLTKMPDGNWGVIVDAATPILEAAFLS